LISQIISKHSGASVSRKLASATVNVLTPIWQRVLQRPSISVDDNFFSIGGTLPLAETLFAEIARACGHKLPGATIYHAPTIAALASLLQQPSLPRLSPVVPLKAGSDPPILIAPGLSGRAGFWSLAKHIQTDHAICGIQARGVDGLDEPLDRIEDMAQLYLDALQALPQNDLPQNAMQHAPYVLIGYSFGGLVALEMAQRLSEAGKNVALLVLVDTYPHPRFLSFGERLRLTAQRARRHVSEVQRRPARSAISYLVHRLKRRLRSAGFGGPAIRVADTTLTQTTRKVKEKAYVALDNYRPRVYNGKIKFIKSASDTYFPGDPVAVWANLAADFEVETVPGGHLDMVTTHFEVLAAVLTRYLKEAFDQK
jgi:acetoacetyl-CoA synthetase